MTMRQGIKAESRTGGCCKDCKDRSIEPVNCHSYCVKYTKAKADAEARKQEIDKVRNKYKDYDGFKMTNVRNTKEHMKNHRPRTK